MKTQHYGATLTAMFTALAVVAVVVCVAHIASWFHALPEDLSYFFAGGEVVGLDHRDPYLEQPLLDRERPWGGPSRLHVAGPVPLPPYDILGFALLARLPLRVALLVWGALLLAAGAITSVIVSRYSRLPLPVATAAVYSGALYEATGLGQIAPLAVATLTIAFWGVRTRRPIVTGFALLASLIQPQLAAPAVVAALIFLPETRVVLLAGIASFFALTTAVVSPRSWFEFAGTLPLQVRAELRFPAQYGIAWISSTFGSSPHVALAIGSITTVACLVVALIVVGRSPDEARASGSVILLPALLSLVGGAFIHSYQLEFALIPAAVLIVPKPRFADASIALALLIVPFGPFASIAARWPTKASFVEISFALATAWAAVFCTNVDFGAAFARAKASVVVAAVGVLFFLLAVFRPTLDVARVSPVGPIHPLDNASIAWGTLCDEMAALFGAGPYLLVAKAVLLLAVIAVTLAIVRTNGGSAQTQAGG